MGVTQIKKQPHSSNAANHADASDTESCLACRNQTGSILPRTTLVVSDRTSSALATITWVTGIRISLMRVTAMNNVTILWTCKYGRCHNQISNSITLDTQGVNLSTADTGRLRRRHFPSVKVQR